MSPKSLLQKQREEQKFEQAVSYVQRAAGGIKKINSNELAHLHEIVSDSKTDPWRFEAVEVKIPSGQLHQFNLVSNPIDRAREILGNALQMAGNGEPEEAAIHAYTQLVLGHLFRDANRRVAVLAATWILVASNLEIDAQKLLKIPLGDLRVDRDRQIFTAQFKTLLRSKASP